LVSTLVSVGVTIIFSWMHRAPRMLVKISR